MPSHKDDLDRILTSPYLDGIDDRSLADIRAMRTECQQAEVALSYLRRLIQGRLDIVHTYLEHPGSDAPPDLASLVDDLPGILSSGPGDPRGPSTCPCSSAPDTEEADLTDELDAVLGADEIASLAGRGSSSCGSWPAGSRPSRTGCPLDRRALHVRIDTLQAEMVAGTRPGGPRSTVCCRERTRPATEEHPRS